MAARKAKTVLSGEVIIAIDADDETAETLSELLIASLDAHQGVKVRLAFLANEDGGDEEEEEADEDEADEDEEEEAEEADDDSDEEGYTEEDLKALGLAELKELAEEYDVDTAKVKGKAKLVAAILEAQDGDEEAEEEEDDEDEDEDDEDVIDEDALNEMALPALKKLAKEQGVTVKVGMKKDALIEAILELAEEE